MPRITSSRCVLAVRDLDVSTRFCIEVLGFARDSGDGSDGWRFLSRPQTKPWGLREFSLRTRDGHRIVGGEPVAAG